MTFPGGTISLPTTLLNPGKSGAMQVHPPEQPTGFARMSDAALFKLADNLATMLETETPETMAPALREYIDLLSMQVAGEMMRRMR